MAPGRRRAVSPESARRCNELEQSIFLPAYPAIADRILRESGTDTGFCLDVGCGPGYLAISLATLSDLLVFAMDDSRPLCQVASENIRNYRLGDRVKTAFGDPGAIPFESGTMDLVVSRRSLYFWESLSRGFAECMRVLRPGGLAWIGNGFGSSRIRDEIAAQMQQRDPGWAERERRHAARCTPHAIRSALAAAGIFAYDLIDDDTGFWVTFRRP